MKISRVAEMRRLDQTAVEAFGIPEELLMENAGDAVCAVISREIGFKDKMFVICCGIGNNGGDGLVVARKLHSNGARGKVFILGDRAKYKGAARLNLDIVSKLNMAVRDAGSADDLRTDMAHADAIVDAIFGTGLMREVTGIYRDIIELINASGKRVVSADIPGRDLTHRFPQLTDKGPAFYRITVRLAQPAVRGYGREFPLRPGMTLLADIQLERKRIIEWIFDPLMAMGRTL